MHEQIDWTRNYEFLEQELQKIVRDAVTKNRRDDAELLSELFKKAIWVDSLESFEQRIKEYGYRCR